MTQPTIAIPLPEPEEEPPEDRNHNPYIVAAILALSIVVLLFYRLSGSQVLPDERTTMAALQNNKSNHIFVDVDGAVVRPGVYRLRVGSRVFDAIASAGGLKPGADRLQIKMAAKLHDEEKLIVPRVGQVLPSATPDPNDTATPEVGEEGPSDLPPDLDPEEQSPPVSQPLPELTPPVEVAPDAHPSPVAVATVPPPPPVDTKPPSGAASPTPAGPAPKPAVEVPAASKVSINRATADQFENIPGVDSKLALDIVNYRKGPPPHAFTSLDDLTSVPGLKQAKFDEILPYLKL